MRQLCRHLSKLVSPVHQFSPSYMSSSSSASVGPLVGVRVVEMGGLAPVPFAGMIMADFGANVVRVDKMNDPMAIDHLTRGKQSIVVDLKTVSGIEIVRRLATDADVLLDPYRPGVMEKLKLGPDELCGANEKLIYARLTGYGQTGPMANRAGHDMNYIAISGLLSRLKRTDSPPQPPINLLADFAGGSLTCVMGVLMALLERGRSGKGQVIDAAMSDGTAYLGSFVYETMDRPNLWPRPEEAGGNLLDGGLPIYDVYETSDGGFMSVAALEPKFHMQLFDKLNLDASECIGQAFSEPEVLRQRLRAIFKGKTRQEWETEFGEIDACVEPVLRLDEAAKHAHNKARRTFAQDHRGMTVPAPAPRLSRTPARPSFTSAITNVGQDTRCILRTVGYGDEEIDRLINEQVIHEHVEKAKL